MTNQPDPGVLAGQWRQLAGVPEWSDQNGWSDATLYLSIRAADFDDDGGSRSGDRGTACRASRGSGDIPPCHLGNGECDSRTGQGRTAPGTPCNGKDWKPLDQVVQYTTDPT
jgi:hypothetical protein